MDFCSSVYYYKVVKKWHFGLSDARRREKSLRRRCDVSQVKKRAKSNRRRRDATRRIDCRLHVKSTLPDALYASRDRTCPVLLQKINNRPSNGLLRSFFSLSPFFSFFLLLLQGDFLTRNIIIVMDYGAPQKK